MQPRGRRGHRAFVFREQGLIIRLVALVDLTRAMRCKAATA